MPEKSDTGNVELNVILVEAGDAIENSHANAAPHQSQFNSDATDSVESASGSEPSIMAYKKCGRNTFCCAPLHICRPIAASVPSSGKPKRWLLQKLLDISNVNADRIVHSYFMPSVPWVVGLRAVFAVYCTCVLLASLITEMDGGYWFAYFTHLSYLGLTIYLWTALMISARYLMDSNASSLHKLPARSQDIFCSVMYTTSYCFHVIVPVVYWALLATSQAQPLKQWLNFSQHGLDFVVIFIEFFLNRIIFSWGHLLIAYVVLIIYIGWGVLAGAIWPASGVPYFFLRLWLASSWLWVFLIAVGTAVIWAALVGVHWLRSLAANRLLAVRHRRVASSGNNPNPSS